MTRADQVRSAEQLLAERRRRDAVFGDAREGFGEPAWDMLLRLFIESAARGAVPIVVVTNEATTPAGTAATYLQWMVSRGLIAIDHDDVRLEARGLELMTTYLNDR